MIVVNCPATNSESRKLFIQSWLSTSINLITKRTAQDEWIFKPLYYSDVQISDGSDAFDAQFQLVAQSSETLITENFTVDFLVVGTVTYATMTSPRPNAPFDTIYRQWLEHVSGEYKT